MQSETDYDQDFYGRRLLLWQRVKQTNKKKQEANQDESRQTVKKINRAGDCGIYLSAVRQLRLINVSMNCLYRRWNLTSSSMVALSAWLHHNTDPSPSEPLRVKPIWQIKKKNGCKCKKACNLSNTNLISCQREMEGKRVKPWRGGQVGQCELKDSQVVVSTNWNQPQLFHKFAELWQKFAFYWLQEMWCNPPNISHGQSETSHISAGHPSDSTS